MRYVVRTPENARDIAKEVARQFNAHRNRGLLVTIEVYKHPATRAQNAKLHVLIAELADHLGYDRDELKYWLKQRFWPHKVVSFGGADVSVPLSTRDLSREEAGTCIEHVLRVAAEMGVTLD